MAITRYEGQPLGTSGLVAGGGYAGITAELDSVVAAGARALAAAYSVPVEIRFNSDRESGGAWLVTADGDNAEVGIGASLVTARKRDRWEASALASERMAATGICTWGGQATSPQREGAAACARHGRQYLADNPEGQLTIYAHIRIASRRGVALVDPELVPELQALDGWTDGGCPSRGYHHGPAASAAAALARCLRFRPSQQDAAQLAAWDTDGGA